MASFSARNTNVYKIRKFRKANFLFCNVLQPNYVILLISKMLFLAVLIDFVFFLRSKLSV